MQILRHTKIDITMEIYSEVLDARTCEALRALGGVVASNVDHPRYDVIEG